MWDRLIDVDQKLRRAPSTQKSAALTVKDAGREESPPFFICREFGEDGGARQVGGVRPVRLARRVTRRRTGEPFRR